MNWNARLALVVGPLQNACIGLTEMPLAAFILLETSSNLGVGLATGAAGLSTLCVAPLSGWLADKLQRQTMLRVASAVSVLNTAFMCTVLLYVQPRVDSHTVYQLLLANQIVYGIRRGIGQPAFEAIFGDSVASGKRSRIYSQRSSLQKLGNAVGPAVAAGIFLSTGDKWTETALTYVLLAGNLLRLVPAVLQCLFRDKQTLGIESEGLHIRQAHQPVPSPAAATSAPMNAAIADTTSIPNAVEASQDRVPPCSSAGPCSPAICEEEEEEPAAMARRKPCLGPQHVAPIIAVANLTARVASGLSVRYFSLYFWKELHLRPAFAMLVLVAAQLGGSAATMGAQKVSLVVGRVQVCIAFRLIGVGMLVAIALSPLQTPEVIIPLYLLRTWFTQSPIGLAKSVLNDYVSKKHRAKWNALDSINMSSWAGSAVLGGFLADKFGSYRPVFLVTAALGALASLLNLPLLYLVAVEGRDTPGNGSRTRDRRTVSTLQGTATGWA